MRFIKLPNGNLQFQLESEIGKDWMKELLERHAGDDVAFMADLLETTGWQPNGGLMAIRPEDVAALTDAPIITDGRTIEDDGTVTVYGNVWWYPDYAIRHFGEVLRDEGQVTFQFAPAVEEVGEACCAA